MARTHLRPSPLGTPTLDRLRAADVEALVHRKRERGSRRRPSGRSSRSWTPSSTPRCGLSAIAQDPLRALYLLLLGTGLRRGEALALRWEDVDLDDVLLCVRGTLSRVDGRLVISEPKTDRSRRQVPVPRPVTAELRAHRVRQLEARLHAGSAWQEHGLAFCSRVGTPLDPRNALRAMNAAARRPG